MSYIGHTREEEARMLGEIGARSFEDLLEQVPAAQRMTAPLDLGPPLTETELRRYFASLAARTYDPNAVVSFLGAGIYDHAIPACVDHLALRSEFYTAYTPYQAEVSQGTLAVSFEFQTMICELTGLEVANASMYDGASAAAEALLLARGATRASKVLLAPGVSPRTRAVITTHLSGQMEIAQVPEIEGRVDVAALRAALCGDEDIAAVLVQQPNFYGLLEPMDAIGAAVSAMGEKPPHLVVSADPVSLGVLAPPAQWGAQTVVGDVQPLGTPAQFGGPTAGYFATRRTHIRRLPGRLVAEAYDAAGRRGFTLTLQTREQHIRREKATSNICTNSALIALRATVYLAMHGAEGLRQVAAACMRGSHYALSRLERIAGVERIYPGAFFREFAVRLPIDAEQLVGRVRDVAGILAGVPLSRFDPTRPRDLLVAVTETRSRTEIDALVEAVRRSISA